MTTRTVDPILLEVVRNRLETIADEMELTLLKSAASPIVKEGLDASAALFNVRGRDDRPGGGDPDPSRLPGVGGPADRAGVPARDDDGGGRVPAERPLRRRHAPARHHAGGAGGRRGPRRRAGVHDVPPPGRRGPDAGERADGRHRALPGRDHHPADPVVARGRAGREPVCPPPAQRAHSGGVHRRPDGPGGRRPAGRDRLNELFRRYGTDAVLGYIDELLERAETLTRRGIEAIPDGTYAFTDWMDDDGIEDRPVRIAVAVTVRGSSMTFDFTGTSPQVRGPFNSVPASTLSAVYYAVRAILGSDRPQQRRLLPRRRRRAAAGQPGQPAGAGAGQLPHGHDQADRRHHPGRARPGAARPHAGRQLGDPPGHGVRRDRPGHRSPVRGQRAGRGRHGRAPGQGRGPRPWRPTSATAWNIPVEALEMNFPAAHRADRALGGLRRRRCDAGRAGAGEGLRGDRDRRHRRPPERALPVGALGPVRRRAGAPRAGRSSSAGTGRARRCPRSGCCSSIRATSSGSTSRAGPAGATRSSGTSPGPGRRAGPPRLRRGGGRGVRRRPLRRPRRGRPRRDEGRDARRFHPGARAPSTGYSTAAGRTAGRPDPAPRGA